MNNSVCVIPFTSPLFGHPPPHRIVQWSIPPAVAPPSVKDNEM